ncbi:sigma-54-dependent transcriptional regulator [Helicobacter typhlonius]|uniref:Sigma-54-dependent Fis family transcriptional regulator n=2 Tax=Helicobacter typhlonius TaxID=76936 RepID=A0A099UDX9_9HELI|nr:sigma-54 dependent transcriptional regulator [Helicobacter typhlonius]TLD78641.1 sigma-54-dependent Fis family transcriptional regulator [Helicobacter typhlonius]CUU40099.1 Signal-transduction regulatory protein FlgR [Helicobacter typhlonius]HCD73772.1 sigma-54-dependent Fis family transcriptional regulator [Helicobacter sp.]
MKIAIVEDDINYRKSLETAFEDYAEYEVVSFKNPKDALKKLDESFELIITDINMPQMDGLSFLQELNGRYEAIVITGNASVQNAIKSIRLGVKDFLIKGFEIEELIEAIKRTHKAAQIVHKTQKTPPKSTDDKEFIASSPKLEEVKALALKVAKTDANVLLLGQSGVGKDVFANFIHRNSARANAPFVALNMAAIPEHLLESELFGYEKGAFTDATNPKPGILESASGGSVFLDEIGEMPLALQAKLLRVLQEKTLTRLGSSKPIKIDVRFISATNADIQAKIGKNEFREDLFFRLQTIPLPIPPLKERKEEILPISEWKLESVCAQYNFPQKSFSEEAKEALLNYEWYGNVRELLSVVERAGILSDSNEISVKDLSLESRTKAFSGTNLKSANAEQGSIAALEKELITQILKECANDLQRASDMLGMSVELLRHKIARYDIK